MSKHLLAARILNAAQAVLGPQPRAARAALLAEHDEFKCLSFAEVLALAGRP